VAIGATSTIGQLLSTEGFRYVQVATGSLLGMLVPVLNYFLGVVAFGEVISWRSVIGSIIILGSCVVVLLKSNNN
jgi:drug/metabolite transporter (DMT)-like permease